MKSCALDFPWPAAAMLYKHQVPKVSQHAVEKISYQAEGLPDGYSISAFVQTSLSRLNIEE